jgi:hypothetical protein
MENLEYLQSVTEDAIDRELYKARFRCLLAYCSEKDIEVIFQEKDLKTALTRMIGHIAESIKLLETCDPKTDKERMFVSEAMPALRLLLQFYLDASKASDEFETITSEGSRIN